MKTNFQARIPARILALILSTVGAASVPPSAQAQTFKILHSFTGGADGGNPAAGTIFDTGGNLYGTTIGGGDAGCFSGCGVVFELSPASGGWSESTLHSFTGGSDGGDPSSGLIFDGAGNLYGTAEVGGVSCGHTFGCGVAFELSPSSGGWTDTVLHSFQGGADGYYPIAALSFGRDGHLYSTLANGGTYGSGSVYELANTVGGWEETILHSFDGWEPEAAVSVDASGNLYSTTYLGGGGHGGTVFELLHGSWKQKIIHGFSGPDGAEPVAGLVFDKSGNLYGTTYVYGKYGKGVVFELAPGSKGKWKETVLHAFKGGRDGSEPLSTPVFDKTGNLYGTTPYGGDPACNCGTVFKLTPGSGGRWKEAVLYRFTGGTDGSVPESTLTIDAAGNLYGTTFFGGNAGCYLNGGCGVVFEITP